jgi:hypothetical protein
MFVLNVAHGAAMSEPIAKETLQLLQDAAVGEGWRIEHDPTPYHLQGSGGMVAKMPSNREKLAEFVALVILGIAETASSLSHRSKQSTVYLTRVGPIFEADRLELRWRFE